MNHPLTHALSNKERELRDKNIELDCKISMLRFEVSEVCADRDRMAVGLATVIALLTQKDGPNVQLALSYAEAALDGPGEEKPCPEG